MPFLLAGLCSCDGLSSRSWEGSEIVVTESRMTNREGHDGKTADAPHYEQLTSGHQTAHLPRRDGNFGNENIPYACSAEPLLSPGPLPATFSTASISILQMLHLHGASEGKQGPYGNPGMQNVVSQPPLLAHLGSSMGLPIV